MNYNGPYDLLTILQHFAPKGEDQAFCAHLYNEMHKDGCTSREIEINLVGMLSDGLKHGNWPWTIRDLKTTNNDEGTNLL